MPKPYNVKFNTTNEVNCCYQCKARRIDCHEVCALYKQHKEEVKKLRDKERKSNSAYFNYDSEWKRSSYIERGRKK